MVRATKSVIGRQVLEVLRNLHAGVFRHRAPEGVRVDIDMPSKSLLTGGAMSDVLRWVQIFRFLRL